MSGPAPVAGGAAPAPVRPPLPPEVACADIGDDLLLTFADGGRSLLVARRDGEHVLRVDSAGTGQQLLPCEGAKVHRLVPHPSAAEVALVAPQRGVWRLGLGDGRLRRACGMRDLAAAGWTQDGTLLVVLYIDYSHHEVLRWEQGARGVSRPVTIARKQVPDLDSDVYLLGTPRWLTSSVPQEGQLTLWPAGAGDPLRVPQTPRRGDVVLRDATADGARLLLELRTDGRVLVVSAGDGAVELELEVGLADALTLDPAGRWLVSHTGQELLLHDLAGPGGGSPGPVLHRIRLPRSDPERAVCSLAVDPAGQWLAVSDGVHVEIHGLAALLELAATQAAVAVGESSVGDVSPAASAPFAAGPLCLERSDVSPSPPTLELAGPPQLTVHRQDEDLRVEVGCLLSNPVGGTVTVGAVDLLLRDSAGALLDVLSQDLDVSFRRQQELQGEHEPEADTLRALGSVEVFATYSRSFRRLHLRARGAAPEAPERGAARGVAWPLELTVLPASPDGPLPRIELAATIRRTPGLVCDLWMLLAAPADRVGELDLVVGLRADDGALLARVEESVGELGPDPRWVSLRVELSAKELRRLRSLDVAFKGVRERTVSLGVYRRV